MACCYWPNIPTLIIKKDPKESSICLGWTTVYTDNLISGLSCELCSRSKHNPNEPWFFGPSIYHHTGALCGYIVLTVPYEQERTITLDVPVRPCAPRGWEIRILLCQCNSLVLNDPGHVMPGHPLLGTGIIIYYTLLLQLLILRDGHRVCQSSSMIREGTFYSWEHCSSPFIEWSGHEFCAPLMLLLQLIPRASLGEGVLYTSWWRRKTSVYADIPEW